MVFDYTDIRYYSNQDFLKYLPELANEPTMQRVLNYFKGGYTVEQTRDFLLSFKSQESFQKDFIIHLLSKIIHDSVEDLSYSGLENVDPNKKYVFITNHRNIVMDVATLNYILYKEQGDLFESTAIAIGNNLLGIPWVKHLARMNKSFLVERDLSPQEMLTSAKRLSAYIRQIVSSGEESIWIAHREGRTKDGNDFTQAGLIKMLTMSGEGLFAENIGELHLLPVVISYEKDPCDLMKLQELASIQQGEKYVKGPMEDFNSMFSGMMGNKGKVHYHFGEEFTPEKLLKINEDIPVNQKVRNFCEYLDKFIYSNYKLHAWNYIASDILNKKECFNHLYTSEQKEQFIVEMKEKISTLQGDEKLYTDIYLKMFAYPVRNYYSIVDHDYTFSF
jgi:1-acyl-sn-glycerol-3-phosphate acyltransferase